MTLAVKTLGVTLVVASGLPCGREGPMVQLGAGISCIVLKAHNRILSLDCFRSVRTQGRVLDEDLDQRDFVAMGAAAGVAAAFDAPIGGVLFGIEEVSTHWSSRLTWMAFLGTMVASLAMKWLTSVWDGNDTMGDEGLFVVWGDSSAIRFTADELPIFLLIGACGGLMGAFFNYCNSGLNRASAAACTRAASAATSDAS